MRILIVSQYFYPENFKINDIAVELVNRGNVVDVVTGMPNYPSGIIYDGYHNRIFDNYLGVNVFRTKIRPRYKGTINLFLNYLSFMLKAKKTISSLKNKYDIVFCYEPSPIFQLTPALYAKSLFNCPAILMCCDQWPESLKARGMSKGLIYNRVSKYCIENMNKCDYILNVAPSFIEYNHKQNKVPYEKMGWHIQPSDDFFIEKKEKEDDSINLVFAGNIGTVQNVEQIILARSLVSIKRLKIHIFGDGSRMNKCAELIKNLNLKEDVIMYGKVDQETLKEYYRKMDGCLLTLTGKSAIGNTIPSKFANYVSLGMPIIAAISGDCEKIITSNKLGLCCQPDNYKLLADIMRDFCLSEDSHKLFGKNCREYYLNNCTIPVFVNDLESLFHQIIVKQ